MVLWQRYPKMVFETLGCIPQRQWHPWLFRERPISIFRWLIAMGANAFSRTRQNPHQVTLMAVAVVPPGPGLVGRFWRSHCRCPRFGARHGDLLFAVWANATKGIGHHPHLATGVAPAVVDRRVHF